MNVNTNAESELSRLSRNLQDYALASKYTMSEVLEKKGNDVRIQLFKLFWEQKFGGGGKRKSDIAFSELERRSRAGKGTLVRQKILNSDVGTPPDKSRTGKKLSLWQKLVWQETERRSHGIGVIAIGFLSRRYRTRKRINSSGQAFIERYVDVNRSRALGDLVRITKTEESFSIEGMTPGMAEVASRYNIPTRAMAAVSDDIEPYLARKFGQAFNKSFKK